MSGTRDIADALRRVQEITDAQLPSLDLRQRQLEPAKLTRFSPELPEELDETERARLQAEVDALKPWLQGPFYLGGDLVIEGLWRNDDRWVGMREHLPDLTGKRVLDVGSNAGYDPFMFTTLGAGEVLACEPFEFIHQARFLESVYRTGARFEQLGWQRLDPQEQGRFDFIHCNGVLYHEADPVGMIRRLRSMLADDGELWLGSMVLADPELSEYARFVRGDYAGDPTWWWVPGRLALRWMMDAAGLEAEYLPMELGGPRGEFRISNRYLRAHLKAPDPMLDPSESTAG